MAKPIAILALNIGSQTIALGEFRSQTGGGLVLENYRFHETLSDIATEGMRYGQLGPPLRQLLIPCRASRAWITRGWKARSGNNAHPSKILL